MLPEAPGRIGVALGSGAARGWAHIGVLRELEERGVRPEVVCGSSSGAIVGAMYAAGRLDALERFARRLDWRQIVGIFDLTTRGGLIKARRVLELLTEELGEAALDSLAMPFAAVATDLGTGREVWLREGPLHEALRASMALPGLVAPVQIDGRWLVDGGLVNAVPVSLCRAMGADTVIAVDLNTMLLGRRLRSTSAHGAATETEVLPVPVDDAPEERGAPSRWQELLAMLRERVGPAEADDEAAVAPSLYEVIANAVNIMQVRITRSRMAGDPPDVLVTPRLGDFALLDFDRADEAIAEGRRAVARAFAASVPGLPGPEA